jgi:hypothetical protein
MSAAAALKPVESPSLMPHRGQLARAERNVWRYFPEPNHTKEQIMAPAYWAHVSRRHRVGDKIEALWEDGSAYAELLIIACDKDYTKTVLLTFLDITGGSAAKADGQFDVQWKGSVKKHCIVRLSDGAVIQEGLQTKVDAEAWLEQNRATLV